MPQINSETPLRFVHRELFSNLPASTYGVLGTIPDATATLALVANTAVVTPFYVDRNIAISQIGTVVTTAGTTGQRVRIALYDWDPITRAAGALIADFGSVLCDATGLAALTPAVARYVASGWYALAIVSDGAPTIRTVLGSSRDFGGTFTVSTTTLVATSHYTVSVTNGISVGFPATLGALTAVTSTSEFRPTQFAVARYVVNAAP
jgi:hypothetical protein